LSNHLLLKAFCCKKIGELKVIDKSINDKRIAFFLPTLNGGGAERISINLLKEMSKHNIPLDLVLATATGPYLKQVPESVRIINLESGRVAKALIPLSNYLKNTKPFALLSHQNYANVIAVLANKLARIQTQLVLVEHITLSQSRTTSIVGNLVPIFMRLLYPQANAIVGVSKGVSSDLEIKLGLTAGHVKTIYNPVVDNILLDQAQERLIHPWFQANNPPIFIAVGRLSKQKDFTNLIQAFAIVRKQIQSRLIILGEGECRYELESLVKSLDLTKDIEMPGFVDNPYAYMSRASAFILSSLWEGLPTVLIEAMACGCPVISTDCPSGPREILEAEKYGILVPISDPTSLSAAMLKSLNSPSNRDKLIERAMFFSNKEATGKYLKLIGYFQ
jgi:glycosyltransferase involved in cell wall biosynthesis